MKTHYQTREYDSKARFASYWHQISEVLARGPKTVLEIGPGNGFVATYLREHGVSILTLDVDKSISPDHVGSVVDLPFESQSFEMVTCFEVLEHLPYESVPMALREISRVTTRYAAISLPDSSRFARIHVELTRLLRLQILATWPQMAKHACSPEADHRWEIGRCGCPLKRIMGDMISAGFSIDKTFRVFENPNHRFFRLSKGQK